MKLFGFLVILSALGWMGSSSVVEETSSQYNCCLSTTLQFDTMCRTLWSVNGMQFAHTHRDFQECIPPCRRIGASWITLDACVNVNVTKVCITAGVPVETRIRYLGQACPSSLPIERAPRSQGSLSSPLLTVIIGLLLLEMIY